MRALLLSDDGSKDEAILCLQNLVFNTQRCLYNRPLMWAILDLATLLRQRATDEDKKQAVSISTTSSP